MTGRDRRKLRRFWSSAFLADWATYLVFTAVPLRAISLGAGPIILGLLPALFATVYVASALLFGSLSDRGGRLRMARVGTVVMAAGAILLWFAPGIAHLFLFLPVFSIGRGLFWPAFQAELGERGLSVELGRRTAWFNVSWSSGKMLGFWTAGHMAEAFGPSAPLLAAASFGLLLLGIVPPDRRGILSPPGTVEEEAPSRSIRRRFRLAAWSANFVGFGVAATLNYQFPNLLFTLGFREGDFGNFLGLVMLVQTATFAGMGVWRGWEYRPAWLSLPLAAGMISAAGLVWARSEIAILACAPGLGFFFAVAYSQSLFHSLHREPVPGRNTGIHEALLGSGSFLLPLAGGGLAGVGGLGAPYLLCAVAIAAVIGMAAYWLRPADRRRGPGS